MAKKQNNGNANKEEENNNPAPEEKQTTPSARTVNGNANGNDPNAIDQVEERFKEYNNNLVENEIPNADSDKTAKKTELENTKYQQNYKTCFYNEAADTQVQYNIINNRIATSLKKDAQLAHDDVNTAVALNQGVKDALAQALAKVVIAKKKAADADASGSSLDDKRYDSACSEELKVLTDGIKSFNKEVDDIVKALDDYADHVDDLYEDFVITSAILGFSNVDSLVPAGNDMKNEIDLFHTNVGENIASSQQKKNEAQAALTTALENTSQADHNLAGAVVTHAGLVKTSEYAQNPADPQPGMTQEDISVKVENIAKQQK